MSSSEPPQACIWKPRWVVACGQLEARADIERNRRVILMQLEEAARKHRARLIVFPETALSGYAPSHWPDGCAYMDFKALNRATNEIRNAAKKYRIAIVLGTTLRGGSPSKPRYYNSALSFDSTGRLLGRYDKIHLTGIETKSGDSVYFEPGSSKNLRPLRLAGVRVGVQICMDMRYPEPWRLLAMAGVRLFLHPTAAFDRAGLWKREPIEGTLATRCAENGCWLASANSAGPFQFVTSRIIDPDGRVVVSAQTDCEQVISAAIDPEWKGRSNFLATRREDCYRLEKRG